MPTIQITSPSFSGGITKCVSVKFGADDYQLQQKEIGVYKLTLSSTSVNIPDGYIKLFGETVIFQDDVDMTSGDENVNAQALFDFLSGVYFLSDYTVTKNGLEITIDTGTLGALDESKFDISGLTGSSQVFEGSDGEFLSGYTILYSLYRNDKKVGQTHSVKPLIACDNTINVPDVNIPVECTPTDLVEILNGKSGTYYIGVYPILDDKDIFKIKYGAIYQEDCDRKSLPFVFSNTYTIDKIKYKTGFLNKRVVICDGEAIVYFGGISAFRIIFPGYAAFYFAVSGSSQFGYTILDKTKLNYYANIAGAPTSPVYIEGILGMFSQRIEIETTCCGDTLYYYNCSIGIWESVVLKVDKKIYSTSGVIGCKTCDDKYMKESKKLLSTEYTYNDDDVLLDIFNSPSVYRMAPYGKLESVYVDVGDFTSGKITIKS